jgi:hypothetical protein
MSGEGPYQLRSDSRKRPLTTTLLPQAGRGRGEAEALETQGKVQERAWT